jgi:hypothetical protein
MIAGLLVSAEGVVKILHVGLASLTAVEMTRGETVKVSGQSDRSGIDHGYVGRHNDTLANPFNARLR